MYLDALLTNHNLRSLYWPSFSWLLYLHRQVRTPDSALRGKIENFKLRITEKEANFEEEIAIDEDNDIEYFSVPAHNDVLAADFLFDFKMVRILPFLHLMGHVSLWNLDVCTGPGVALLADCT